MNYKDKDNASVEEALQLVKEGLEDPDTHLSKCFSQPKTVWTRSEFLIWVTSL